MSTEMVKSAGQRVRALLAKLQDPLSALEQITQGAEAHIDALAPSFAALEASPFEGVATFATERPPAPAFESRAARRVLEPSLLPTGSPRPVEPAVPAVRTSTTPPSESPTAPARVLPVSPRTALSDALVALRDSIRNSNESKAYTLSKLSESNRSADLIGEQQKTIADASTKLAEREAEQAKEERAKEEPVSLGELAGAALRRGRAREKEAEAKERTASPPVIGPAPPLATTGFAQGAVLRPAMRAARPAAPTPPSPPTRSGAQLNDLPLPHANQGAPLPDVGPTVRRGVPFYFDPLEARPAADDTDDTLAERIGQVLREQARRQGVDLT